MDALGNPLRWLITAGQVADITQAPALLAGFPFKLAIADRGYDADPLIEDIQMRKAQAVIPPRSNRIILRDFDHHWYKDRNLIERFFNRIKQFRRIATRYEKLDINL